MLAGSQRGCKREEGSSDVLFCVKLETFVICNRCIPAVHVAEAQMS